MDIDLRGAKIAIIDDEKDLVETIKQFLEARGFSICVAYNGREGLEMIKREKPEAVVLDITMPIMDGRDVLIALKRAKETREIPIIMLTAKDEQFDRGYAIDLGAVEYVTKPYDSTILLRQIQNVLSKKRKGEV